MDWLLKVDEAVFLALNKGVANPVLDWLMPFITNSDHWVIPMGLMALALLIFGKEKGRLVVLLLLIVITLSDQLSASVLKPLIGRLRPCHPDHLLSGGRFLMGVKTSFSFPSSHAANMGAAASLFSVKYPRLKWVFIFIGAMVAYSRVYVGVHFPLDVLAGAILGVACAGTVLLLEKGVASLIQQRRQRNTVLKEQD